MLDNVQKINNIDIEQSEQLNNNGRMPESNKSIRLLFKSIIGRVFCLKILPILFAGLLVSGCVGETLFTIGPIQYKQSDIVTTPYKLYQLQNKAKEKTDE